jgi:hypothetical protein
LLRREQGQIQPEATLAAVRVRIYWPEVACPQWWTVSIWMKPGSFRSSEVEKVRMEIGDTVFEEARGFDEGFALECGSGLAFPGYAVDGGPAYGHKFFADGGGDAEGRPVGDIAHLPAHEGCQELPAFIPEECPDQAQGGDDFIGVDFFALPAYLGALVWRV